MQMLHQDDNIQISFLAKICSRPQFFIDYNETKSQKKSIFHVDWKNENRFAILHLVINLETNIWHEIFLY